MGWELEWLERVAEVNAVVSDGTQWLPRQGAKINPVFDQRGMHNSSICGHHRGHPR